MNHLAIRNEVRRRVVSAASIAAATDLKIAGQDFDTSGKSFWAEEHLIGGAELPMTNQRNRIGGYLIQYDLCCPIGTSLDAVEQKAAVIETSLLGASFVIDGTDCIIRTIKTTRSEGKRYNAALVLLTLELNKAGS